MNSDGKIESKPLSINSNTTTTPWANAVGLVSMLVNITGTPTSWVVTVQSKAATPVIIFSKSYSAASVNPDQVFPGDITAYLEMTGGIDIITSGTTPGVANVVLTVIRLAHD